MNFLPGMNPGHIPVVGNPDLLMRLISATANVETNLTFPASDISEGDILVYIGTVTRDSSSPPAVDLPSGFTSLFTDAHTASGDSFSLRMRVGVKEADGTEEGTVHNVTSSSVIISEGAALLQFRPNNKGIASIDIFEPQFEATSGGIANQTKGSGYAYHLHCAQWCSGFNAVSLRGYSVTEDQELVSPFGGVNATYTKWKLMNPSRDAVAVTASRVDDGPTNGMGSFTLRFNL